MTAAEIRAYNDGVEAVLRVAKAAAEAIALTSKRRIHGDFAIAALAEVAEAGRALLITEPSEARYAGAT